MWRETETDNGTILVNYDHVVFVTPKEDGTSALVYTDGSVIDINAGFEGLKRALLNLGDINMRG